MLTTEQAQRIMLEVDLGIPASKSQVPPSAAADEFRAKMDTEIAAIKARGLGVKHYDEFPTLTHEDLAKPSTLGHEIHRLDGDEPFPDYGAGSKE